MTPRPLKCSTAIFLLTPLREGRREDGGRAALLRYFYSRPCGRGDYGRYRWTILSHKFLLTPLREGRRCCSWRQSRA